MSAPSSASRPSGGSSAEPSRALRPGQIALLLCAAAALLALLLGHRYQAALPPCGYQFQAHEPVFSGAWWRCPLEVNRHQRVVGDIGSQGLQSVQFLADGRRGWAVGLRGTILATQDGGKTWSPQVSNTKEHLTSVTLLPDGQRGWAVGWNGTILATQDGGKTWSPQASNTKVDLASVTLLADGLRGWAVGREGTILATQDGGKTWLPQVSNSTGALTSVTLLADGLRGWAVVWNGTILATQDGGKTWSPQASNTESGLRSVTLLPDGLRGWAVGDSGTILATQDGGKTWSPQVSNSTEALTSVTLLPDGQRGWAVGWNGIILATQDGGKTWSPQASNRKLVLHSVTLLADGLRGWAVGTYGTILATQDGGKTWAPQASNSTEALTSVTLLADGLRGWAVGFEGTILATQDGGKTWAPQASNTGLGLRSVTLLADGLRGWAVGFRGTILATQDGGKTWSPQASNTRVHLNSVTLLPDGLRGWAVGWNGTILATQDGGKTWLPQVSNSTGALTSVTLLADGLRGWAVGDNGTILATQDGGKTWAPQASNTRKTLNSVTLLADGLRGWAVGFSGTILATQDGGNTWSPQARNTTEHLHSVTLLADGLRGWAVGAPGNILTTQDGGTNWRQIDNYGRWPPPLYTFATGLILLTLALAGIWLWATRAGEASFDRLLGKAVSDAPLSRADQDRLNFRPVVEALSLFLLHKKTQAPLTVALTAPWGRGKSSMMAMLRQALQRSGSRTVWFNAWHHQKEPVLLAALLSAIVAQATPQWLSLGGLVFRTELVLRRFRRQPLLGLGPLLLWLLLAWAAPLSLLWLGLSLALTGASESGLSPVFATWADGLHQAARSLTSNPASEALLAGEWSKFARETVGALGSDPVQVLSLLATLWFLLSLFLLFTHYARAFPARPGALLASVGPKFSLSAAEEQTGLRQRFRDHFGDVTRSLQPHTLTIFIDDIDRCDPKNAAEMLESINYLSDAGPCFLVLGLAEEIVEAQLGEVYKELAARHHAFEDARKGQPPSAVGDAAVQLKYARNYLEKLIQIRVPVPALSQEGLGALMLDGDGNDAARQASAENPAPPPAEQAKTLAALKWQSAVEARLARAGWALRAALLLGAGLLVAQQSAAWLRTVEQRQRAVLALMLDDYTQADRRLQSAREFAHELKAGPRTDAPDAVARARPNAKPGATANANAAPASAASAASAPPAQPTLTQPARQALEERVRAEVDASRALLDALREQIHGLEPAAFAQQGGSPAPEGNSALIKEARPASFVRTLARLDAKLRSVEGASRTFVLPTRANKPAGLSATPGTEPGAEQASRATPGTENKPPLREGAPSRPDAWTRDAPMGLLLLFTLLGLWFGRKLIRPEDSKEYEKALAQCQPLLATLRSLRAPREVKRFVNRTRYLAVRVNARAYMQSAWWQRYLPGGRAKLDALLPKAPELGERELVALMALHLARSKLAPQTSLGDWLAAEPAARVATTEEVDAPHSVLHQALNQVMQVLGVNEPDQGVSPSKLREFLQAAGEFESKSQPQEPSMPLPG